MTFIPVCEPLMAGNEEKYVLDAVRSGWVSSAGKYVGEFESGFSKYCGVRHGISVTNGTTALHLALRALGVGPGDEVILPDFTMVATLFSVLYCGATPVFVDVERDTFNMDPALLEAKITEKTKVIMPVHIFGHPCDMERINAIAQRHGIAVVEDAAEAHGAEFEGKKCGAMSNLACFSFFANKILTTGEGGMVVTDDEELADKCRYYKNLCFNLRGPRDYSHADLGYNYRFTNLHAAIGLAQLEKLDEYVAMRRRNARLYNERLAGVPGVITPVERPGTKNVYWMYGVMLDPRIIKRPRAEVLAVLKEKGVDHRLWFKPMHDQPLLAQYGIVDKGEYPVTRAASEHGFYLPSSSSLTEEQIDYISKTLVAAVS